MLSGRPTFGQLLHQRPHGGMKTIHVSAAITGRGHAHHKEVAFLAEFAQQQPYILANGLRQTGGRDSDQFRVVLARHVVQAMVQVVASAEHGGGFAEAGNGDVDRLAKMRNQVAANVGGAALRSVQKGHRARYAAQRQTGAQGRAQLAGIARGCERFLHFRPRGVSFHTGLATVL